MPAFRNPISNPTHSTHRYVRSLAPAERAEVREATLVLREDPTRPTIEAHVEEHAALSHDDVVLDSDDNHGWDPADARFVRSWAERSGLTVVDEHSCPAGRRLQVRGSVEQLDTALGIRSHLFETTRNLDGASVQYRRSLAEPVLPRALGDVVTAVQVDEVPRQPRITPLAPGATPMQVYNPEDLAVLYNFPDLPNGGAGVTLNIGISELDGAVTASVAGWFFKQPQYKNCTMTEFGVNNHVITSSAGADLEVALDWQVALRALVKKAPQANINILVGYGDNTDPGFAGVWNSFVTDAGVTSAKTYSAANPTGIAVDPKTIKPSSASNVSDSWGNGESLWKATSLNDMNNIAGAGAVKGISFHNASGDNGAADKRTDGKLDIDGPSECPNVFAWGGSTLLSANRKITSEVVWNEKATNQGASGSGVARVFPLPTYQQGINVPAADDGHIGRIGPDGMLNGDSLTGYNVVTSIDTAGNPVIEVVGGTSASTPLGAAGFTLVSAMNGGKKLGRIQDTLYTLAKKKLGVNDVTQGDTAYPTGTKGYPAGPDFDGASGWGSFDFTVIAKNWGPTIPTPQQPNLPAPAAASPFTLN